MTDQLSMDNLTFLGPQDGDPERDLMNALIPAFTKLPDIQSAYLARVSYAPDQGESVALCLSASANESVVEQISQLFANMFNQESSLDIIFIDDEQEQRLAKICPPFYVSMARN